MSLLWLLHYIYHISYQLYINFLCSHVCYIIFTNQSLWPSIFLLINAESEYRIRPSNLQVGHEWSYIFNAYYAKLINLPVATFKLASLRSFYDRWWPASMLSCRPNWLKHHQQIKCYLSYKSVDDGYRK